MCPLFLSGNLITAPSLLFRPRRKKIAFMPTTSAVRWSLLLGVVASFFLLLPKLAAQEAKPIFDGRLDLKPTALSAAEELLLNNSVLPAAKTAWHARQRDTDCMPDFPSKFLDVAAGSFTRAAGRQRAILYKFCTVGQGMALNGIAIIENDKLVAHLIYDGGEDYAIGALPDIDGNGLSEIVLTGGGTNQGVTWQAIAMVAIDGAKITKFGHIGTSSDDCGRNETHGKTEAKKISVKAGSTPAFFSEVFVRRGCEDQPVNWKKLGALAPLTLEEDTVEYELLK
jgi:hypothetical protein